MTKIEIIRRVAFSIAPSAPTPSKAEPTVTDNIIGFNDVFKIALARVFQEVFTEALCDLDGTPNAAFLRRLHEACIDNTDRMLRIRPLEQTTVIDHRKMVATIAEIAKELGIEYEPPNDRFMQ